MANIQPRQGRIRNFLYRTWLNPWSDWALDGTLAANGRVLNIKDETSCSATMDSEHGGGFLATIIDMGANSMRAAQGG